MDFRGLPVFIHAKSSAASSIEASDSIAEMGRFLLLGGWLLLLPLCAPDAFKSARTRASPVGDTSAAASLVAMFRKDSALLLPLPGSLSSMGLLFLQPMQLHCKEQAAPAWKHSQYFFRHADFRQRQPTLCTGAGAARPLPTPLPLPLLPVPPLLPSPEEPFHAASPLALTAVVSRVNLVLNAWALRARIALMAPSRAAAVAGMLRQFKHLQVPFSHILDAAKHWQYLRPVKRIQDMVSGRKSEYLVRAKKIQQ